jgi:cold shock CspA family protein
MSAAQPLYIYGMVMSFHPLRGFGWVSRPGNDNRIQFHKAACAGADQDRLRAGVYCRFVLDRSTAGAPRVPKLLRRRRSDMIPEGDGSPLVAATIRHVHTPGYVEYGFVRRDSGGRDLYFHRSVVEGTTDEDLGRGVASASASRPADAASRAFRG